MADSNGVLPDRARLFLRLDLGTDVPDDVVEGRFQRSLGLVADQSADPREVGHAADHVLEGVAAERLGVGHVADLRTAAGHRPDHLGQLVDGHFPIAPDVEDPAAAFGRAEQAHEGADHVVDVAEAAALPAVAVDGDRLAEQGLAHEAGTTIP